MKKLIIWRAGYRSIPRGPKSRLSGRALLWPLGHFALKKFCRVGFIFAISGVILAACFNCMAQDSARDVFIETMQGSVEEIDAEGSTLVFQTAAGDIEFFIPAKAKLFRGTEAVKFSDIQKEDIAVISFYSDAKDRKQVLSMVMEE